MYVRGCGAIPIAAAVCGSLVLGSATSVAQPTGEPREKSAAEPPAAPAPAPSEPSRAPAGPPAGRRLPPGRNRWGPASVRGRRRSAAGPSRGAVGYLRLHYVVAQNDPEVLSWPRRRLQLQNARIASRRARGARGGSCSRSTAPSKREHITCPSASPRRLRDAYSASWSAAGSSFAPLLPTVVAYAALIPTRRGRSSTSRSRAAACARPRASRLGPDPGRSLGAALRLDPELPNTGAFRLRARGAERRAIRVDTTTTSRPCGGAAARFPGKLARRACGTNRASSGPAFPPDETDLQAAGLYSPPSVFRRRRHLSAYDISHHGRPAPERRRRPRGAPDPRRRVGAGGVRVPVLLPRSLELDHDGSCDGAHRGRHGRRATVSHARAGAAHPRR